MIARYSSDCVAVMNHCRAQEKVLAVANGRHTYLKQDEEFLTGEILQAKVDNYKLKIALGDTHNTCEA